MPGFQRLYSKEPEIFAELLHTFPIVSCLINCNAKIYSNALSSMYEYPNSKYPSHRGISPYDSVSKGCVN